MTAFASYASRCSYCDRGIEEGDEIAEVDGEWLHADCAADFEEDE